MSSLNWMYTALAYRFDSYLLLSAASRLRSPSFFFFFFCYLMNKNGKFLLQNNEKTGPSSSFDGASLDFGAYIPTTITTTVSRLVGFVLSKTKKKEWCHGSFAPPAAVDVLFKIYNYILTIITLCSAVVAHRSPTTASIFIIIIYI